MITSPNNSNNAAGVIKFFSLKKNTSRNPNYQGKATSVSANRPYLKKSHILHPSKGSNSCRLDVTSKSHNNRKVN